MRVVFLRHKANQVKGKIRQHKNCSEDTSRTATQSLMTSDLGGAIGFMNLVEIDQNGAMKKLNITRDSIQNCTCEFR